MVSIHRKLNLSLSDILKNIDLSYTDMIKPRRKLRDHHENSKDKMLAQEQRSDLQSMLVHKPQNPQCVSLLFKVSKYFHNHKFICWCPLYASGY